MKCPSCEKPLTLLETIRTSVWAEYTCSNCHKRSKRPKANQLLSIPIIVVMPSINRWFSGSGLFVSGLLTLVIAFVGLVVLTFAFGQLVLIDEVSSEKK
jgi:hypothetical protein